MSVGPNGSMYVLQYLVSSCCLASSGSPLQAQVRKYRKANGEHHQKDVKITSKFHFITPSTVIIKTGEITEVRREAEAHQRTEG